MEYERSFYDYKCYMSTLFNSTDAPTDKSKVLIVVPIAVGVVVVGTFAVAVYIFIEKKSKRGKIFKSIQGYACSYFSTEVK